jgi:hypothetical protein
MNLPAWVLAIFLGIAAAVPVGVYFFAALFFPPDVLYTYSGYGLHAAPGPIAGAGLPLLAAGFGVYWMIKRRRKADWHPEAERTGQAASLGGLFIFKSCVAHHASIGCGASSAHRFGDMQDVQAQSGEADNSINLPQQIAGNIFEKLRAVTFTSKVKTRVRLRCEAEAVWLLNVLVISQRWQAHLPEGYAGGTAILCFVRGVLFLCERTAREHLRSQEGGQVGSQRRLTATCKLTPKKSRLKAALKIKKLLEPLKYTDSRVRVCFFLAASLPPPSAPICEARVFHLVAGRAIHISYSNLVWLCRTFVPSFPPTQKSMSL